MEKSYVFVMGALFLFFLVGVPLLEGWDKRYRERIAAKQAPKAVCDGCGHHYSYHDHTAGACKATDLREKFNIDGKHIGDFESACHCTVYVGPVPDNAAHIARLLNLPEIGDGASRNPEG